MTLDDFSETARAIRWGLTTDELHDFERVINACRQGDVPHDDPVRGMLLYVLLSEQAKTYVDAMIAEYSRQSGGTTFELASLLASTAMTEYAEELALTFVREFGISWYVAGEHTETMHAVWTIDEFVHAFVESMISY